MGSRVPDLFKRPGALASLRPAAIQQHVHQQQLAAQAHTGESQLLQRLHACLDAAAIQEALGSGPHTQSSSRRRRQLDAYHRVFELLLASLTTYRPLLLRVKHAYDDALRDAAAAACDNVCLHSKLALVTHRQAEAIASSRQAAVVTAAGMEDELQHKLGQLEQDTQQAEAECLDVESQLQHVQRHLVQARREVDQLGAACRRGHKELLDSSSWHMLSLNEPAA